MSVQAYSIDVEEMSKQVYTKVQLLKPVRASLNEKDYRKFRVLAKKLGNLTDYALTKKAVMRFMEEMKTPDACMCIWFLTSYSMLATALSIVTL